MTDTPKEPTTMDLLVAQINAYKAQQAQANATRDDIVAQCEGGIKTCLWMIKVLNDAAQKDAELKAAAEAEEALRKEQDKAAAEAAAEISGNIFDAGKAALQVAQDIQIEDCAAGPYTSCGDDLQRPETGLIGTDAVINQQQVHAGELEPPKEDDWDILQDKENLQVLADSRAPTDPQR